MNETSAEQRPLCPFPLITKQILLGRFHLAFRSKSQTNKRNHVIFPTSLSLNPSFPRPSWHHQSLLVIHEGSLFPLKFGVVEETENILAMG